jgi:zinc-binding alcohol dehydrogenase family protein
MSAFPHPASGMSSCRCTLLASPPRSLSGLPPGWTVRARLAPLKPGGVLISVVPPPEEAGHPGARGVFFVVEPERAELVELARRIDAGEVRSVVGEVFPLRRGREAFEAKWRSGTPGKVVLRVADRDLPGVPSPSEATRSDSIEDGIA